MAETRTNDLLRHLRCLLGRTEGEGVADAQLLERFVTQHDEAAFELLVWRHQRLVLGVCRRATGNLHDAEDAFQATFLALARKAGSIGRGEALACWLYRVAQRIAVRARTLARRRSACEQQGHDLAAVPAPDGPEGKGDLGPLLDQEVYRLPEKYRAPLVLCYLEGKTYDEAARQLNWPRGTVATRLTKARALLRGRLARRGVALAALAGVLGGPSAAPALIQTTSRAAARVAVGEAAGGVVAPRVAALMEGALRAMRMTRIKIAAVVLLAVSVFGGVSLWPGAGPEAQAGAKKDAPAGKAKTDQERLQGTWQAVAIEAPVQKVPPEEARTFRLTFKGDRVHIEKRFERGSGTYRLDPASKPGAIDFQIENRGAVGIYEFAGERLRLCMTEGDTPRPTEFRVKEKEILMVLERVPAGAPKEKDPPAAPNREVLALRQQVAALQAHLADLRALNGVLREQMKRRAEEITGVLKKVDVEKNTVSFTLGQTRLAVNAVPLSTHAKYYLGSKECGINDLKNGMSVAVRLETKDDRSEVILLRAEPAAK